MYSTSRRKLIIWEINPVHFGYRWTDTLANSEKRNEMLHKAAFHPGLHCLLRLKQSSRTEIHNSIEILTSTTLKIQNGLF